MGRKHWEKEKLLVMSNFSFSRSVFERLVSHERQKVSLSGNGLKHKFFGGNGQLYHTVQSCNHNKENTGKRRKCRSTAFSLFTSMVLLINFATFNLSSANAFNLVQFKILFFGKESRDYIDQSKTDVEFVCCRMVQCFRVLFSMKPSMLWNQTRDWTVKLSSCMCSWQPLWSLLYLASTN